MNLKQYFKKNANPFSKFQFIRQLNILFVMILALLVVSIIFGVLFGAYYNDRNSFLHIRDEAMYRMRGIVQISHGIGEIREIVSRMASESGAFRLSLLDSEGDIEFLPEGNEEAFQAFSRNALNRTEDMQDSGGYYYFLYPADGYDIAAAVHKDVVYASYGHAYIWIIPGILAAAFIVFSLIFKKNIYQPIKKVEKALEVVSGEDDNLEFDLAIDPSSELYEVASYINKMIYKLKEFANREYTATILMKQAELKALQTQINPHFLYNTLDSIRGLALIEGQENIAKMTKALSGLFRYSISKTEDLSAFREELKNVENYMTIQQLRFSNKFIFIKDIELNEETEIMDCALPKLTIQPIVENAVYHGLETKIGKGTIIIRAYTTEKRLVISIEDDGIGMSQETVESINEKLMSSYDPYSESRNEKSTSIALVNVNERIKLFFGPNYGLKVLSTQNIGTTVEIVLPLVKQ